jgi:integrase
VLKFLKICSDFWRESGLKAFPADKELVFHSFRKSFTNELKQRIVPDSVIQDIVGHSHGAITFDTYTLPHNLKTMLEAMEKMDFGIDFSPLKRIVAGEL